VQVLTHDVMTLQAEGNVAKAHEMLKTLGVIRPPVRQLLDRLRDVPVDIAPRFTTADRLVNEDLGRAPAAPGGARD